MSLKSYSHKCIRRYLEKYNLVLEESGHTDRHGYVGDLFLYIKVYDVEHSKKSIQLRKKIDDEMIKIGHLHYSLDYDQDNLQIDKVNIKSCHKPKLPIKLFKILLLYLLAFNADDIKSVSLTYSKKIGKEFCLTCYYEELGFKPVNFEVGDMVKMCLIKNRTDSAMCTLCKCQKYNLPFTKRDLKFLQVDMKVLLPRLKLCLNDAYRTVEEDC